jgi:hypothetical protein
MSWDWTSLVKTAAPWIGTAIGGPLGGIAVAALGKALGVDLPTADKIGTALQGITPEQTAALRQAEQEFQAHMAELGIDQMEKLAQLDASDRDSARAREAAVKDLTPRIIALVTVAAAYAVGAAIVYCWLAGVKLNADPVLAGAVGTVIGWIMKDHSQVVGYYFGSSAGSDKKTDLMAKAAEETS